MGLSGDPPGALPPRGAPDASSGEEMPEPGRTLAIAACIAALLTSSAAAADAPGPAGAGHPAGCDRRLVALDAGGRPVFETVALLSRRPGIAVAPLHPLERLGVRWDHLEVRSMDAGAGRPVIAA